MKKLLIAIALVLILMPVIPAQALYDGKTTLFHSTWESIEQFQSWVNEPGNQDLQFDMFDPITNFAYSLQWNALDDGYPVNVAYGTDGITYPVMPVGDSNVAGNLIMVKGNGLYFVYRDDTKVKLWKIYYGR